MKFEFKPALMGARCEVRVNAAGAEMSRGSHSQRVRFADVTGARLVEPETPDQIIPGEVWVTSGDDGKMPLGVRVGTARKVGEEWRLDLALDAGPIDFVRLVPPPDFASPDLVPPLGAVQENTDSTLRTVSAAPAPVAPPAANAPRPATTPATPATTPGQGGAQ